MEEPRMDAAEEKALFDRVWQRVKPEGSSMLLTGETMIPAATAASESMPLGEGCAAAVPFLRESIELELKNSRSCALLLNRYGMSGNMADLAARCHRRAKRLAAALMLISGVWYLPEQQATPRRWSDCRGSLRGLFHTFQRAGRCYQQAAQRCQDPLLMELFQELGKESMEMRDMVRKLLEQ